MIVRSRSALARMTWTVEAAEYICKSIETICWCRASLTKWLVVLKDHQPRLKIVSYLKES